MEPNTIRFSEKYGENSRISYSVKPGRKFIDTFYYNNEPDCNWYSLNWIVTGFKKVLYEVFLPQGYPESVSKDYYEYQFWDSIQAFCSTITGTLSTHSILKEVGVGDSSATALAATITWVLKDTSSMLTRITFAWWKGYMLDTECKKWRFGADIINDTALGIEIMLNCALLKPVSSIMLCISTCLKAIVGVAGGATRAAVTQHQAIRGNTGDVSAKDGSQEMCVNLIASFVALLVLSYVENNMILMGLVYTFITFMHLYSNYRAVHCLVIKTLNAERLNLLIKHFLDKKIIKDPPKINKEEAVIPGYGLSDKKICGYKIFLGSSLRKVSEMKRDPLDNSNILAFGKLHQYFIFTLDEKKQLHVVFPDGVISAVVLQSYFHSIILGITNDIVHKQISDYSDNSLYAELEKIIAVQCKNDSGDSCGYLSDKVMEIVDIFVNKYWEVFLKGLQEEGWNLNMHQLVVDECRLAWSWTSNTPDVLLF